MELTLAEAKKIVEGAEVKAKQIGVPMNIAVVDVGGNLVAFERMDKAWLGSINIAINKAFTAVAFNMTTEDLGKESQPGKSLFGIHATNMGRLVIFGGGTPLRKGGELVGAIGVSGGTVPQDIEVAGAGVKAFK
ncbi:MAG: heme-binding protein [Methanophagales archaeon ANME-1-THS]|nr:MAG: heme-binding protein [Methanophagales archaeon ANME-1-THS]